MPSISKTVLITGCSDGGIGSALAKEFQTRGHKVFAGLRNINKAESLSNLSNVTLVTLDVTNKDSITHAVKFIEGETGGSGLDILINNAGHGSPSPLVDADLDAGRKMFEVNFWGVLAMIQAFTPMLVISQGTIVNISSLGAKIHTPWIGLYSCSKAAVTMASDTLRLEMKPLGVNVVNAMVGMVETHFGDNLVDVVLPDSSFYKPVESDVNSTPGGKGQNMASNKMKVDVFADRLVGDILAGKRGHIWRGGWSTISRIILAILPRWIMVSPLIMEYMFSN
jgi:NAD(P)-dependent dehydrogenase (short-subunit alcohol dehydrogenase family)